MIPALQVVKSLVLIDAVCLLTCWPGLLYNFIYREPSCSLDGKGCLDVLRFICARDLMIAEVSNPFAVHCFPSQICFAEFKRTDWLCRHDTWAQGVMAVAEVSLLTSRCSAVISHGVH